MPASQLLALILNSRLCILKLNLFCSSLLIELCVQVKLLRQIILSGMGDHVARYNVTINNMLTNSDDRKIHTGDMNAQDRKKYKNAYQVCVRACLCACLCLVICVLCVIVYHYVCV